MGKVFIPNLCRCNSMNQKYFLFMSGEPNGLFISRNICFYECFFLKWEMFLNVKFSITVRAAVLLFLILTFNDDCQQCFVLQSPISPILLENFIPYFPWVRAGDGNDINYRPTDLRPPTTNQSNHLALHHQTSKGFGIILHYIILFKDSCHYIIELCEL